MTAQDDPRRDDTRERALDRYLALLTEARSPLLAQGDVVREQLIGQFRAIFDAAWAPNASDMVEILSLTIGNQRAAAAVDPAASLAAANMIFIAALPAVSQEYHRRGVANPHEAAAIRLNEAVLRRMAAAAQAYVGALASHGTALTGQADPPRHRAAKVLTPKETEVLAAVAAGHSNRDIAAQMEISEATVKRHLATVLRKFDVRNRLAAVARARSLGLLE